MLMHSCHVCQHLFHLTSLIDSVVITSTQQAKENEYFSLNCFQQFFFEGSVSLYIKEGQLAVAGQTILVCFIYKKMESNIFFSSFWQFLLDDKVISLL
jgi:hypothetical protein